MSVWILLRCVAGAAIILALNQSHAQSTPTPTLTPIPTVQPPHWLIEHWAPDGTVQALASQAPTTLVAPASLTKLLTAYTVLHDTPPQALKMPLTVPAECAAIEGTRVGYAPLEQVPIFDALQGMLAVSGNDAACALAVHSGGLSAFTERMNAHSTRLGASGNQWRNSHGLSETGHETTAHGVLRIAHALWQEFPQHRAWLGRKTYTWRGVTQANRNTLLHRDPRVQGLKTGHTGAAGYNLAVTQSVLVKLEEDIYDWRLSSVVLGATSAAQRAHGSAALLDWARTSYQPWRLYASGALAGRWLLEGVAEPTALHLTYNGLWAVLKRGNDPQALHYAFEPHPAQTAPYAAGQSVGRMAVYQGAQRLGSAPVVTHHAVAASPWYAFTWAWFMRGMRQSLIVVCILSLIGGYHGSPPMAVL